MRAPNATATPSRVEPPRRSVVSASEIGRSMSCPSPRTMPRDRLRAGRRTGAATRPAAVDLRDAKPGVATWRPRVTTSVRVTRVAAPSELRPREDSLSAAESSAPKDAACVPAGSATAAADELEASAVAGAGCEAGAGSAGSAGAGGAWTDGRAPASSVALGEAAAPAGVSLAPTAGSTRGGRNDSGST
jgi:hypothetical protein